jgi:hypothetical protein
MKTIKFLTVLCFILAFSANNAISQKVIGEQITPWSFTPNQPGQNQFQIPCLTEVVSGDVTEYQSFTNNTYHVMPRGVLYGETSGEKYEISYEFNFSGPSVGADVFRWHNTLILTHDNKIVAVIHMAGGYIINGKGVIIRDFYVVSVNCK